jgi:hypothetical protein
MKNFIGQDGFVWWIGVVEDINDPLTLGRCKVRCFGYHPAKSTNQVPTEDLPWALTIHPLNTPNLYGTPRIGEWVFGFFLDSMSAQEPAILGYLPAIPQAAAEYFGTSPSLTRNFATVTNRDDILWQTTNSNITIDTDKNLLLKAKNSTINSNAELTLIGNDVTIRSNTELTLIGNDATIRSNTNLTLIGNDVAINSNADLTLRDSLYNTTLTELILRIETLEERLDNPTKTLVPNTSIMAITNI